MIVALVISLIFNVLLVGLAFYLNESWYRDEIRLIKDFDKEYSRLNNRWAEFCNKWFDDVANRIKAAIKEVNDAES